MEYLCVAGGNSLAGEVQVSGAKNAALPLLISALLSGEECVFENVPNLDDISKLMRMFRSFGVDASFQDHTARITASKISRFEAPYGLVKSLRASFWVLGPLLARCGQARVALPGGDAIGTRPVDLHLKGLEKFGVTFRLEHGVVHASVPGRLRPAKIKLEYPSVGATHQLLMTAASIPGETIIEGAAREPEVEELASVLRLMGAEIQGAGSGTIQIFGTDSPSGIKHKIIGDRIEAATYLLGAAITQGDVTVHGIPGSILESTLDVIRSAGAQVDSGDDYIRVRCGRRLSAVSFDTAPFPGVATDVQPLLMAALCAAEGQSCVHETVFESRFGHVAEYRRFGAKISIDGRKAYIDGTSDLSAAPVEGLDIRAAAGMVLLGLVADGVTQVRDIHHLDRGYDGLVTKFQTIGADIARLPAYELKEEVWGC